MFDAQFGLWKLEQLQQLNGFFSLAFRIVPYSLELGRGSSMFIEYTTKNKTSGKAHLVVGCSDIQNVPHIFQLFSEDLSYLLGMTAATRRNVTNLHQNFELFVETNGLIGIQHPFNLHCKKKKLIFSHGPQII